MQEQLAWQLAREESVSRIGSAADAATAANRDGSTAKDEISGGGQLCIPPSEGERAASVAVRASIMHRLLRACAHAEMVRASAAYTYIGA